MGYANVSLVYARWGHLPDRPFRLLCYMALRSRDEDTPPRFYEGREACALALGRLTPEEPASSDESDRAGDFRRARRNDFEAVKVAIRSLVKADVLAILEPAAPGRNAVYALQLMAATGKGSPVERGRITPSTGKDYPVERGRLSLPPTEEPPTGVHTEDTRGKVRSPSAAASPAAPEMTIDEADSILDSLPDGGAWLMKQVDYVKDAELRRIEAARLFRRDESAS